MVGRRVVMLALFCASCAAWWAGALLAAPPQFMYRAGFLALAMLIAVSTYWAPRVGWWLCVGLLPLANMPARALALGAHDAVSFLALACVLGWWAHRLITRAHSFLYEYVRVPLALILAVTAGAGLVTLARYADWYPLLNDVFRNVWVTRDATMDAAQALRVVLIRTTNALALPALFWCGVDIWRALRTRAAWQATWQRLAQWWTLTLLPVFALVVYQSVFDPAFGLANEAAWQAARRVSGGMTDPNALGLFLLLALPLLLVQALRARGLWQMVALCSAALGVYALMQSGSRSALLGITAMALMAAGGLMRHAWRQRAWRGWALAGVTLGGAVLIAGVPLWLASPAGALPSDNPVVRRLQEFYERARLAPGEQVVDRRELQWRQALTVWRDYPFSGVGLGAFAIELPNYNRDAVQETPVDNAWNQYLQWLTDVGASGLLFWLWLLGSCGVCIVRARRRGALREMPLDVRVAWGSGAVVLALGMVGAHFQAPEVACGMAVLASVGLAPLLTTPEPQPALERRTPAVLILIAGLCLAAQVDTACGPLSRTALQRRFGMPREFGLYRAETWQQQFRYQWTQRYAGRQIVVPEHAGVMTIRLAGLRPDLSPAKPAHVRCWLNARYIDTIVLRDPHWTAYSMYVYDTPPGVAQFALEVTPTWQPTNETPPRVLGVALADDITWDNDLRREGQNLSPWFNDRDGTTNVPARWTEQRAARFITAGTQGCVLVRMRAPSDTPFYRVPPVVTLQFNGQPLQDVTLPRSRVQWLTVTNCYENLRGMRGILSIITSRTATVRIPGGVRRQRVGVALAELETY
jgi:O-antigen ligase